MTFFKTFKDPWTKLALLSLIVLLGLEWWLKYDTLQRQIALSITNIFVITIYYLVYKRLKNKYQIILPGYVAWAVALGVWLDAAGNFAHFYQSYFWYDNLTHFEGSISVAIPIFYIFYKFNSQGYFKLNRFHLISYSICLSMFLVCIYEISEWLGDLLFETYRVTARFDTPSDFLYNLLGVLSVALVSIWLTRKKKFFLA